MSKYQTLQTLSFRLAPGTDTLPHATWVLATPEKWKSTFRELQAQKWDRGPEVTAVRSVGLHKALRALVPGLIAIDANAWKQNSDSWLYAATPIKTEAIWQIVRAWARAEFGEQLAAERGLLRHLGAEDLQWRQEVVDLATRKVAGNGTAEPSSPHAYHLLPDLLASRLSAPGVELDAGAEPLRFLRAPLPATPQSAPGSKGAELVSWPPIIFDTGKVRAPFSVVLNFSVQTVPFQEFAVVHCDIGRRRWAYSHDDWGVKLPRGEDTSVYLLSSVPWIEELEHSPAFQIAPMCWQSIPEAEQKSGRYARGAWSTKDSFASILKYLQTHLPFPDAEEIRTNPQSALNPLGNQSAAITFRDGMTPAHEAGVGISPRARRALTERIAALLQPEIVLSEPMARARDISWHKSANPFPPEPKHDTPENIAKSAHLAEERKEALSQSFEGDIGFEIWFQSQPEREALRSALRAKLGMDQGHSFPFAPLGSCCTFHLSERELGKLGDVLDVPLSGAKPGQIIAAIKKRAEEVKAQVLAPSYPTVALIQLMPRKDFRTLDSSGKSDPKSALRRAFALAGRLSQFLSTETGAEAENLGHRAQHAVLDALRQLGLQLPLPRLKADGTPIHAVGVWILKSFSAHTVTRRAEHIPILVRVDGATGEVEAIAGKMDSWQSYHKVLQLIGAGEVRGVSRFTDVAPLLQKLVRRDLRLGEDTLLLCHAQNTRTTWPWLQNPRLTPNAMAFGSEPTEPIEEWRGLRVVRVRESDNHETPESYAIGPEGDSGFTKGLFRQSERIFMSQNPKAPQFRPNTRRTPLAPWENSKGQARPASMGERDHNPTLCELTMACLQPGDDVEEWAAFVHELRSEATHHGDATALPLPLHLAKLMDEYVLPMSLDHDEN